MKKMIFVGSKDGSKVSVKLNGKELESRPIYIGLKRKEPKFEWGANSGAGASDLSSAILNQVLGSENVTLKMISAFKWQFISNIRGNNWIVEGKQVEKWCQKFLRNQ